VTIDIVSNKARSRALLAAGLLLTATAYGCASAPRSPPLPPATAPEPVKASRHAPGSGETVSVLDVDGDGLDDTWSYSVENPGSGRVVVRRERDLDGDGRTDVWEELEAGGRVSTRALDLDRDGHPDVTLRYDASGRLAVREYAFGRDGRPHARAFYENGSLARRERDLDGDGKADAWEHWQGGELDHLGATGVAERRRPPAPPGDAAAPLPAQK
jgi:hypothetical protein